MKKRSFVLVLIILLISSVVVVLLSCLFGASDVGAKSALKVISSIFTGESVPEYYRLIIFKLRLPRALMAFVIGGGLAVSGCALQGLFKNPLVDSGILGVASGAGLGAAVAIVFGLTFGNMLFPFAFLGGLLGIVLVYFLALSKGKISSLRLLLSGIAAGTLMTALTSGIMILNRDSMDRVVAWTMGSLTSVSWEKLSFTAPIIIIASLILLLDAKKLNIALLGKEEAKMLGINISALRIRVMLFTSLITSAAVAAVGIIGFVGIMIPHVIRILSGPDHRSLLPLSFFGGGVLLMLSDLLARNMIPPMEIPVGIITAVVGGAFFLYLLKTRKI